MAPLINLEFQALVQESAHLNAGIRAGIKSLCIEFYSEGLLEYSCNSNISEDALVENVLTALQNRVKTDPPAFYKILKCLYKMISLEYLAEKLEDKLRKLKEAHTRALKLENVRKQQQIEQEMMIREQQEELVIQQEGFKRCRPHSISPAISSGIELFRVAGISEPAATYRDKSPQAMFQEQASSLGSGILRYTLPETQQDSYPLNHMEPIDRIQHRTDSRAQLATGMDRMLFQVSHMTQATPTTQATPITPAPPTILPGGNSAGMQSNFYPKTDSEHKMTESTLTHVATKLEAIHIRETPRHFPAIGGYTPVTGGHTPATGGHTPEMGGHIPGTGHTPAMGSHTPGHIPETGRTPATGGHTPATGYSPSMGGHTPATAGHIPATGGHIPAIGGHMQAGHSPSSILGSKDIEPIEHPSLPETTQTRYRGQATYLKPVLQHTRSNTFDSNDQYTTPPSSPKREDSITSQTSTASVGCDRCFEMKRTISELEKEINTLVTEKWKLKESEDNVVEMSREQMNSLRNEVYQAEVAKIGDKMAYDRRHREQEAIIMDLRAKEQNMRLEIEQLRSKFNQGLLMELSEERRGREQERLEKERAILSTKVERLNTEREKEGRENEKRLKEEWMAYCRQLEEEYQWLSGQVKKANSLQCETDDSYPVEYGQSQSGTGMSHSFEGVESWENPRRSSVQLAEQNHNQLPQSSLAHTDHLSHANNQAPPSSYAHNQAPPPGYTYRDAQGPPASHPPSSHTHSQATPPSHAYSQSPTSSHVAPPSSHAHSQCPL